jgi:hypothetical protein
MEHATKSAKTLTSFLRDDYPFHHLNILYDWLDFETMAAVFNTDKRARRISFTIAGRTALLGALFRRSRRECELFLQKPWVKRGIGVWTDVDTQLLKHGTPVVVFVFDMPMCAGWQLESKLCCHDMEAIRIHCYNPNHPCMSKAYDQYYVNMFHARAVLGLIPSLFLPMVNTRDRDLEKRLSCTLKK